jgi:putative ubiquitin-RnfH superfamily antitoxin RatB of RatAB toxin-antitoxin module
MHSRAGRGRCSVPTEKIAIEVVCAEAERQTVIPLDVDEGCTAAAAIHRSGIFALHPGLDPDACGIGIFGHEVGRDRKLRAGDRVEILRPLADDPRERRRRLARQGGTMGRSSA